MFGSGQTQAQTQTVASGVDIQSSCYGGVVPVVYGQARLTGNLIWYGDFQAIAMQSAASSGGKGGDSNHGSTTYDYKASFIFALGEGTLAGVRNVWASKTKKSFDKSNLSFSNGDMAQAPWGYLTSKHSDQALSYAGTAYVAAMAYDLGQSAQMPNLSYEVTGLMSGAYSATVDANPANVVLDVLTNARYGVGFPAARIPSLGFAEFVVYCQALGLGVSPVFDTQSDAASQLNKIVQSCNAEFVWSGSGLFIVPYGDQSVTGNGATYTPPSAPLFSLTDNDFLHENGNDPVQCSRARPSDQMNSIRFEFLDRTHDYNASIVEAKNQAAIEAYGLRGDQPEQMHHFCDANAAKMAATLKLQRQSVRNIYSFTLGWRYCLLDPMDIVEISDSGLGLNQQWVRILSLEEDDNGNIRVTAEEYLGGTGHAPLYDFEPGTPYSADYNVAPGNVSDTLIFEPSPVMLAARSITAPQIMVGACGGADWGGCEVHLSLDNATYKRIGRIPAPARMGVLTANLASGADPDTSHTLSVNLAESAGSLGAGTQSDADDFRTLCYVDGELIAYENRTLTGTNSYDLDYLRRGVHGSTIAAHAAGTKFCRLDEAVKSFDLPITPVSYVGRTLYLKFLSYNIYGGALQDISEVSPVTFVPGGAGVFVFPPTAVSFSVGTEQQGDGTWISFGVVAWTASQDPLFDQYEVQYRLHAGPGPWISWRGGKDATSFRIEPLAPNTAYDVQVRAVRTSGPFYSAWDQALNITSTVKTTAPPAPTGLTVLGGYRQIVVNWTASAENDIAWYEIWEAPNANLANALQIGKVNATHYVRTGLNLSDTRFYWVRAVDTSGNLSLYAGPGSATTNAVDAGDITGQIVNAQIAAGAIEGANLANNVIDYSKMASGYGIAASVSALPGPGSPLRYAGSLVLLTTNAKLYRWDSVGSAWTVATDGADITANSIVASSLVAGIITAPYLAAGAVTAEKLFIGDTTNLCLDDMFLDQTYWALVNATSSLGTVVTYAAPLATTDPNYPNNVNRLSALGALAVNTGTIPASATSNYGAVSAMIRVKQGLNYRFSANARASSATVPNKNAQLFVQFYDQNQNLLSSFNGANGPQTGGAYAPTDAGEDGNSFVSAGGSIMVNTCVAPAGTYYAQIFPCLPGNAPTAAAGNGGVWFFSHIRCERQSVGTLIEDGAITTQHITAAGIDGTAITAGTVTGDRINGNFIDGNDFSTIHAAGQGFIEINGQTQTVGGLLNGPWFRVNDGSHDRMVMGRQGGAWGLWLNDASGNPVVSEYQFGTGVVVTKNLGSGAVSGAATATVSSGSFGSGMGTWNGIASTSFTLHDSAKAQLSAMVQFGFVGGPGNWGVRLLVDGSVVAFVATGVANTQVSTTISWSGTLSGSAGGTTHSFALEWEADTSIRVDGGSMFALGMQR